MNRLLNRRPLSLFASPLTGAHLGSNKAYEANRVPFMDRLLAAYCRKQWRGSYRLSKILREQNIKPLIQTQSRYGAKFFLSPLDYIDSFVLLCGYYESEVLESILPFLDSNAVFWDVGANFGLHAITAKYLRPEAKVLCIEPSPVMITRLQANAELNNLEIEIISVALTDSPGFRTLHLNGTNPGMTTLKPLETASYSGKVLCWCDTGDNLVMRKELPAPVVIKMDVEGSEIEVLRGLSNTLSNDRLKAIILEGELDLITNADNELRRILTSAGFGIRVLNRNEATHHRLHNFLAVRM